MLNRKESKTCNGSGSLARNGQRIPAPKGRARRRFIISARAAARAEPPNHEGRNGAGKPHSVGQAHASSARPQGSPEGPGPNAVDLAETIKTLLHLAHENGHVTYDDINDVLPEGLSPEDLDELYTKLRNLDVEIVDHAEVERAKPAEPE